MTEDADLVSGLYVEPDGNGRWRFPHVPPGERGVVFGGQLLAQLAAAAAAAEGSGTKTIKSAHGLFARPVLVDEEATVSVEFLHSGRAFSSATATMWQKDRECAKALVLLDVFEKDLIRHGAEAPDVGTPEAAVPWGDPTAGREVRTVGGVDILDADTTGPAEVHAWVRVPGATDAQVLNQCLLAHATASFLIGSAMLPHAGVGQSIAHRDISTGILGHTISFHEEVDLRDWVLLSNESPYAGRGRSFGRGQVFSRSGQLLASYSQEAMIRHFPEGQSPAGRESTIF